MSNYKIYDIILTDFIILIGIIAIAGITVPLLLGYPIILFFVLLGVLGLSSYVLTVKVRANNKLKGGIKIWRN